jgi:hypothetical protein
MDPQSWEEHTEIRPRVPVAQRWGWLLVAGAVVAVGVAAATFFVPRRTIIDPAFHDTLVTQARALAMALDATAGTAHQRSAKLASDPVLRAAILTDAQTVADLVASEHFPLAPLAGETMELFQRDGDSVTSLVRTPPGGTPLHWMPGSGTRLETIGNALVVIVSAEVDRLKDGVGYKATISGSLAIADPIGLDRVRAELGKVCATAVLDGAGKGSLVVLPPSPGAVGAPVRLTVRPNPEWFGDLTLVVEPRTRSIEQAWVPPVRYGLFGLAALLLIARIAAGKRRSPAPRAGRRG